MTHNIYYPQQNKPKMISVTTNYDCKWQVKGMTEYKFAKKKLFNCQRGKEVKKVLNGYTVGYNLRGKFYSLSRIKEMIEPVEEIFCPF
jgi:hypothetical protein